MIVVGLLFTGWFAILTVALSLTWAAKRGDEAIEQAREGDPFEQVDAVVFEFPRHTPGGWKA